MRELVLFARTSTRCSSATAGPDGASSRHWRGCYFRPASPERHRRGRRLSGPPAALLLPYALTSPALDGVLMSHVPRGLFDRSAACETCVLSKGHAEFYQCRAEPPRVGGHGKSARWPVVAADDWCGKYTPAGEVILRARGVHRECRTDDE